MERGSKDSVLDAALVPLQYPTGDGAETATEFAIDPGEVPRRVRRRPAGRADRRDGRDPAPGRRAGVLRAVGPAGLEVAAVLGGASRPATRRPARTWSGRWPSAPGPRSPRRRLARDHGLPARDGRRGDLDRGSSRRPARRGRPQAMRPTGADLPVESALPSLDGATGWLNSEPLTPRASGARSSWSTSGRTPASTGSARSRTSVRGRRSTRPQGLVVVGVHTPEFPFERDVDNVRRAAEEMDVGYPIALDSEYEVWRAFANQYWPAAYIADAEGRIRHHHFGEGEYEEAGAGHPAAAGRRRRPASRSLQAVSRPRPTGRA